ncbi:MerR family transcriptional regulator [Sulfurospirillum arcachonense]|uniref:MerR family transcriptional regulator n=1 Tax=Sulfurospirillum arcachonense TaxID=57666 RepID=UPI0004683627|nr:MerR family transcriptional regulator [Sulfurospirillum arcachonense]
MLKMSELIALSGESKSTILYYIKEGILPPPLKLKANVHRYEEECVERISMIKYLQSNFSYSIAEIKQIFQNNTFDFSNDLAFLQGSFEMISGGKENIRCFSKEDFIKEVQITEPELNEWISQELLFPKDSMFSKLDLEMAVLLKICKENDISYNLFTRYVKMANELAVLEYELGATIIEKGISNGSSHRLVFDILLKLKPYIFNNATINEHSKRVQNTPKDNS